MGIWFAAVPITALVGATAVAFIRGWRRLRQLDINPDSDVFNPTSLHALITFLAAMALLLIAVLPLMPFTNRYFSAHVVQHLLLTAWIPSLFWVANPLPALYVGLPKRWRQYGRNLHTAHPNLRRTIRALTAPGAVWIAFIAIFWLWYDPTIHQTLLTKSWIRPFEIITLFTTSMLYWWHIMAAMPLLHQPMPPLIRIGYALLGAWPIKVVGLIVLIVDRPIYPYPNTFRLSGLDINDQAIGGIIIWIVGGIVFTFTATMLMRRWLEKEELKPVLPLAFWASEEALKAPHRQ